MCGIIGYDKINGDADNKSILALITAMLYFASSRGKDATGYVACDKQGNVTYDKAPLKALDFIKQGGMKFPSTPKAFIGHTRASTSGSPLFNYNNHPLITDKVGLVHNGFIPSWESSSEYKEIRDKMRTQTDSELFSIYIEEHKKIDNIDKVIDGSFALAYMYWNEGIPYIVRNKSPLVYADMTSIIGATFFASTKEIITSAIEAAFKRFPVDKIDIIDVPTYQLFKLNNGKLKPLYKLKKRAPIIPVYDRNISRQSYSGYIQNYNNFNIGNDNDVPISRVHNNVISTFYSRIDSAYRATQLLQRFANMYYNDANPWQRRASETAEILANRFLKIYNIKQ